MKIKENSRSTPYDDVFRILTAESGSLLIPFVNELFQFKEPLGNEQYADHGGGNQEKRITDAKLRINSTLFHLECEAYHDKYVVVRMAPYDLQKGDG